MGPSVFIRMSWIRTHLDVTLRWSVTKCRLDGICSMIPSNPATPTKQTGGPLLGSSVLFIHKCRPDGICRGEYVFLSAVHGGYFLSPRIASFCGGGAGGIQNCVQWAEEGKEICSDGSLFLYGTAAGDLSGAGWEKGGAGCLAPREWGGCLAGGGTPGCGAAQGRRGAFLGAEILPGGSIRAWVKPGGFSFWPFCC